MLFIELAEQVMAQRERDGVRGFDREVSRFRCHLRDACFARKEIAQVGPPDIREWLREMAQKNAVAPGEPRRLSRHTINRCQSLVSNVFTEAVERELIQTNPCSQVRQKKRVDESDTQEKWAYLTADEQRAIAECEDIPRADRLAILFAIITREITIHPTLCEVAQAFADSSGAEQAMFFHEVALVFLSWGRLERDSQLLEIAKKVNPQGSAADFIRELSDAIQYPTASR